MKRKLNVILGILNHDMWHNECHVTKNPTIVQTNLIPHTPFAYHWWGVGHPRHWVPWALWWAEWHCPGGWALWDTASTHSTLRQRLALRDPPAVPCQKKFKMREVPKYPFIRDQNTLLLGRIQSNWTWVPLWHPACPIWECRLTIFFPNMRKDNQTNFPRWPCIQQTWPRGCANRTPPPLLGGIGGHLLHYQQK